MDCQGEGNSQLPSPFLFSGFPEKEEVICWMVSQVCRSLINNYMSNNERMYAIVFDLDTDKLKALYHNTSWNNAYKDIEKVLVKEGFKRQQESVYFGDKDKINAVSCVLAVQKLAKQLTWFSESVKDIQMLRIEENSDLGKAIKNTYL